MLVGFQSKVSGYYNYLKSNTFSHPVKPKLTVSEENEVDARVHVLTIDLLRACFIQAKYVLTFPRIFNPILSLRVRRENDINRLFFNRKLKVWKDYSKLYNTVPSYKQKLDDIVNLLENKRKVERKANVIALIVLIATGIIFGITGSFLVAVAVGSIAMVALSYNRFKNSETNKINVLILLRINSLESDLDYQNYVNVFKTSLNFAELKTGLVFTEDDVKAAM